MAHWSDRLATAMRAAGVTTAAELARLADITPELARKYTAGLVDAPRKPTPQRIADALGVEVAWLMHGTLPMERGAPPVQPGPSRSRDQIEASVVFGRRVAEQRRRIGITTPAAAAMGLSITARRWELIEQGGAEPTVLEMRLIAERVRASLDWLVSGVVAQGDPGAFAEGGPPAPKRLQEPPPPPAAFKR